MPDHDVHAYPTVESTIHAIAAWVSKYRNRFSLSDDFDRCSPEEVTQTARDLGLLPGELRALAAKGPHAADRLRAMLLALGVDPAALTRNDPVVMRDLQRLCAVCSHKHRCDRELAHATAAQNFRDFCPNAYTLDALFVEGKKRACELTA